VSDKALTSPPRPRRRPPAPGACRWIADTVTG
jgi:hypothetical protein